MQATGVYDVALGGIKPIETHYKGYRFRSRLEARWAVYFDTIGLDWEYEHEGYDLGEFGYYLPDFYSSSMDVFFEVKPVYPTDDYMRKIRAITQIKPLILLVGTPSLRFYDAFTSNQELKVVVSYDHKIMPEYGFWYSSSDASLEDFISGGWTVIRGDVEFDRRDWPLSDAIRAVSAARSARFEHGER